ncbi:hypothetical protein Q4601_08630 [Shewanella sp. 1_MG-2023]|uniref:Uncharacterized protein n=1 Tax=Shewanella electrodiphila TaxID=934143 RepID=A0ABT0KLB4_9GAMM|nr:MULTISPECIES: hypothetical protein [Shewanella]MCC4832258.1 hypothetical protein [Shewanella sp. 10N.7]MCL1044569.1 hypothetical protein [Shewanella electrodiphila]MDO6610356.1 hypothetical protein [Shewanella sp. 7_MG-2023]MDO6770481.1 hypothetical protein [Shewanella sp. 2_MG-2023]MDO6794368.1 hypothetical protein [Shewanella sp. 1_MG-2023]
MEILAMGMPRWNFSDAVETRIRITCLLITVGIMVYEYFNGDSSTQYPAMYICVFIFPAVYFTNRIQTKYFPFMKEYVQATRIAAIIMTLSSFAVWCYATYLRLSIPPMPSHLIFTQ